MPDENTTSALAGPSEQTASATPMTGADAVLRALEAEGAEVCFGLPGGAILPLYDAIARGTTIRHVLAQHEQGAGHMAQGYARATGRPGVVFATSGPGATNIVTPIADAQMDSTPLVCVTGQVRSDLIGTQAFQECDIVAVTAPLVKGSWQVREPSELTAVVSEAYRLAKAGRPGPVLVDIPRDVQEALVDPEPAPGRVDFVSPPATEEAIAAVARAIEAASRPVLYVGGGAVAAEAGAEVLALAEAARIPVVTTLMAKGVVPESHPLNFGCPGMHGGKWANWALNMSDLLIAVGARFDDRVTGRVEEFAPAAKVAHYDIDPREIGKIRHAELPVLGDLRDAVARTRLALAAPGPQRGLAGSGAGLARALPAPLRHRRARPQGPAGARAAGRGDRRPPRRGLDHRRRPAPDVGDAVPALRAAALVHHLRRPRDDGLRPPRRDRRPRRPSRRDRRLRRRRRLLLDDLPGARDGGRRATAGDRRRRSTTASSAWSANGRRCSTTIASPRSARRPRPTSPPWPAASAPAAIR